MKNNLFSEGIDAGFYLFTYITFPIVSTFVGLNSIADSSTSLAYWYLTILCNAFCCFHDCINRWEKGASVKNGKLLIMCVSIFIIIIYSFTEMFFILNGLEYRLDSILICYVVVVRIACVDIFRLFYSGVYFK